MSQVTGKVAQIIGPVVDVAFASGVELPKIYDSLEIAKEDGSEVGSRGTISYWRRYRKSHLYGFYRRIK